MDEQTWQTEQFERHRAHLHAVAYRMLGSLSEADDAVQEAWLRLNRSDTDAVENLGGWLTTVVGRVCLDMLRTRRTRREDYVGTWLPEPIVAADQAAGPEDEALLADSVGLALPPVGAIVVVSMPTVVDLPAPLGPSSPNTSPGATSKSMPLTASTPPG